MNQLLEKYRGNKFYFLVLSLISGCLLSIAWYKPFTPLIFIAFLPIFEIERCIYEGEFKYPKLTLFLYTYISLLVWNIGVYWWLWYASGWMTLVGWMCACIWMSIPIMFFHIIKKASNNKFGYFSFIMCWIAFQYLELHWDLSWVWLNIGNVFANYPSWVQWYEYTGVFGGAFWILLANIYAFMWLKKGTSKGLFIATVILPLFISLVMFYTYEEKGEPVEVVVVQPNIDCYKEKFHYNARTGERNQPTHIPYEQQVDRLIELSQNAITDKTQYVAWPETSLHNTLYEPHILQDKNIRKVKRFLQKYPHVSLVTGMDSYLTYESDITPTTRYRKNIGYYDIFNTALLINNQQDTAFYHKSKLVIGVETIPFKSVLKHIIMNFGGSSGGLGTQKEREVFYNSDSVGIAPVICYESIYGEFVTDYILKGASLIFIITNDGWWSDFPGHKQHLAYASLRAIETRKSIARSANTGISCFINQKGEIVTPSEYGEPAAIKGSILQNDEMTVYTRFGDYIGRLSAFLAVAMLLSAYVKRKVTQ